MAAFIECSVHGCAKGVWARGWCGTHYARWRRHGDPSVVKPPPRGPRKVRPVCVVDGCATQAAYGKGWCSRHYTRWHRHGSPTARVRGEIVAGKRICPTCGVDTPCDEFSSSYCFACEAQRVKQRRTHNPSLVWKGAAARRARLLGALVEVFDREEIFERDGWVCQICQNLVDSGTRHPDPRAPTVDHVVPLSRGGKHERANVQTACFRCNNRKAAAVPANA